jgi:hypothetical protein
MNVTKNKPKTQLELSLEPYFKEFEEKAIEWKEKAEALVVTDASDTDLMASAREARLALRQIRIGVNHKHAELKEEALKTGQTLDAIRRRLVGLIEPLESHLQEQEDFVAIKEREAKEQLTNERIALLEPYIGEQASLMSLGDMDEAVFNTVLEGQKAAQKQKEQEEADRIASEAKAAEGVRIEQERIRRERDRVRKLSELGFKWMNDLRRYEFTTSDGNRLIIDMQIVGDFNNEEFDELLESVIPSIQKDKDKVAKEKARLEKLEQEKRDKANASRRLKRAPDKTKLLNLADQITFLQYPDVSDEEARKILNNATDLLAKVVKYIKANAEKL